MHNSHLIHRHELMASDRLSAALLLGGSVILVASLLYVLWQAANAI
jgi:hypothetical protein